MKMNERDLIFVSCPTCKKELPWVAEQRYKPFCSQRCKLVDLGDWATEAHKIPGESIEFHELNGFGQSSE